MSVSTMLDPRHCVLTSTVQIHERHDIDPHLMMPNSMDRTPQRQSFGPSGTPPPPDIVGDLPGYGHVPTIQMTSRAGRNSTCARASSSKRRGDPPEDDPDDPSHLVITLGEKQFCTAQ
eukprot:5128922-Amphidinium_carterae.1